MTEEVKKIRNEIVQKFCRTILWIDDEIHLDKGLDGEGVNPLFKEKFNEFTKSGCLCHMMGFPEVRPGKDPYASELEVAEVLSSCETLAQQANIVIIDWMLGTTDSCEYATRIIKKLLGEDKGFRFIVVLSRKELNNSDITGLDASFKNDETGKGFKNASGQFLLGLQKDEFIGSDLFVGICNTLLDSYPDYLHLAALEMAGRIKDVVPRWLSNIPSSTDIGILTERGCTFVDNPNSWNNELQECISTNLLEDLSCIVSGETLKTLSPDSLKPSNCNCHNTIVAFNPTDVPLKSLIEPFKKCVTDDSPVPFSKGNYQNLSDKRSDDTIRLFVEGIEAYAGFCDTISGKILPEHRVCPGAVYEGLDGNEHSVAVCITAGCDCVRGNSLLFLTATPMPEKSVQEIIVPDYPNMRKIKGSKTIVRINNKTYVFKCDADSLLVKKSSEIATKTIKAILRQDILNRLIGRYMSHTQRFGVNQPEIVRNLRDEGES